MLKLPMVAFPDLQAPPNLGSAARLQSPANLSAGGGKNKRAMGRRPLKSVKVWAILGAADSALAVPSDGGYNSGVKPHPGKKEPPAT